MLITIMWSCINKALEHFGFGPDFQNWVKIIYNGAQSCVTNNGYASEFFLIYQEKCDKVVVYHRTFS